MIVVAMRNCNGIHFLIAHDIVKRETRTSLALGVSARVHQQPVAFDFQEPGRGADVRVRVQFVIFTP